MYMRGAVDSYNWSVVTHGVGRWMQHDLDMGVVPKREDLDLSMEIIVCGYILKPCICGKWQPRSDLLGIGFPHDDTLSKYFDTFYPPDHVNNHY
ncbi:hypothetical protein FRX31_025781 [Thalictrum thalictroides]|uniref:Uncharacterized protein n=1 Tax=Thalictrum thalictroides TaxID=46969 RepID=A0A7J6VIU0_THATH|nr:hypothetical protein FRX31_025781 [Thalictrum thalictroides]